MLQDGESMRHVLGKAGVRTEGGWKSSRGRQLAGGERTPMGLLVCVGTSFGKPRGGIEGRGSWGVDVGSWH